ncbi:TetR/AcrR family transcriptional regulator [Demequina sp.]|uniref:TetR/AcrR family transcriptional regulator n=1 Tax=Demequina sp. TaxID=2050685 RepID=UPI003D14FACA
MGESERGAATREHILATATAMFGESGYRGASLRDIAARCGLTHPGLLYHFPTKAGLLEAVLMRRDQDDSALAGAAERGLDALNSLVEVARKNSGTRGLVELFATLSAEATAPDHPAHAYFVARYDRVVAEISQHFVELIEDGKARPGLDPADAGRQWVALMDGLQIQWLLNESIDMAGVLKTHLDAQLA